MRLRPLALAALGAVFITSAAAPAFADRDGWRHGWRDHGWRHHGWRGPHWHRGYYGPPPVVYAPPPVVYAPPPVYRGYYPPPPVYYANPGVTFGFTVR